MSKCPPHHWLITLTVGEDGERYNHHQCLKCQAEKDILIPSSRPGWMMGKKVVKYPPVTVEPQPRYGLGARRRPGQE